MRRRGASTGSCARSCTRPETACMSTEAVLLQRALCLGELRNAAAATRVATAVPSSPACIPAAAPVCLRACPAGSMPRALPSQPAPSPTWRSSSAPAAARPACCGRPAQRSVTVCHLASQRPPQPCRQLYPPGMVSSSIGRPQHRRYRPLHWRQWSRSGPPTLATHLLPPPRPRRSVGCWQPTLGRRLRRRLPRSLCLPPPRSPPRWMPPQQLRQRRRLRRLCWRMRCPHKRRALVWWRPRVCCPRLCESWGNCFFFGGGDGKKNSFFRCLRAAGLSGWSYAAAGWPTQGTRVGCAGSHNTQAGLPLCHCNPRRLKARSLSTGEEMWSVPLQPVSAPTAAAGSVAVVTPDGLQVRRRPPGDIPFDNDVPWMRVPDLCWLLPAWLCCCSARDALNP